MIAEEGGEIKAQEEFQMDVALAVKTTVNLIVIEAFFEAAKRYER